MKSKILILAAVALLLVSCGTQKSAAVATTESAAPVTETTKAVTLTPELAEGKNLYENSCVRCHKLYDAKQFSQEEWKPILTRMQKKAKLDDSQIASISNYITSQL